VRDVRVDRQLDLDLGRACLALALEVGDGLADHPDVEVEADAGDVAGLLPAEQVAGAADLEVLHGDLHAGAEVGVRRDRLEPVVRGLGERLVRRVEEVRVRPLTSAADAAPQLVQLGEPELVGPLDDKGVGVGDVETGLDDRRAHQDVEAALPEVDDDLLERCSPILPWAVATRASGTSSRSRAAVRSRVHRLWTKKTCPSRSSSRRIAAATCFSSYGPTKVRTGWRSSGGVCERRHLADAGHRHLERARDGVADIASTSTLVRIALSCSLCSTPKRCSSSMTTSPRSLNLALAGEQPVGADDESTLPSARPGDDVLGLLVGLEAGERPRPSPGSPRTARRRCCRAAARAASSARARRPACRPGSP
jgi:hypothetical protein